MTNSLQDAVEMLESALAPSRFTLKVRKCFVLGGGLPYCQLPKLAVIDLVRVFRFET